MDAEIAVRTEGLTVTYGPVHALTDVDVEVPAGLTVGLAGPSGGGKTSFIRSLLGLTKPDRGVIEVLGHRMPSSVVFPDIGYMAQSSSLYEPLSIRENLEFFAAMYRGVGDDAVNEVLELIELADRADSPVSTLSGGMRQRAALAAALMHRPRLLLLDEPTVGLDPRLRMRFWEYFRGLNEDGTTVIVSSHVMDEVERADRVIVLVSGHIAAFGTPEALREQAGAATMEEAFLTLAGDAAIT